MGAQEGAGEGRTCRWGVAGAGVVVRRPQVVGWALVVPGLCHSICQQGVRGEMVGSSLPVGGSWRVEGQRPLGAGLRPWQVGG
jgi:hypothetical protein